MSKLIEQHKAEAAELALELYNLELRRKQIKKRLDTISVIIKTAEHCGAQQAKEGEGNG